MKKDNYRDYAVEAFRYYSLCGRPDQMTLRSMRSVLPAGQRGALADLEAVSRVLERLATEAGGEQTAGCIEMVYFAQPRSVPSRGTISARALRACGELCMSESTVYRALRRARLMFALERGLRVSEDELSLLRS